jgi:hypothetical protein
MDVTGYDTIIGSFIVSKEHTTVESILVNITIFNMTILAGIHMNKTKPLSIV